MNEAQITINLELTGEQAWNGRQETIKVFAAANTPQEALVAATYELIVALRDQGHMLSGFGSKKHVCKPQTPFGLFGIPPSKITEEMLQEEGVNL